MNVNDLYYHPHLQEYVQVTNRAGTWVEFLVKSKNELRWLELQVFEYAFRYYDQGDPITANLTLLREQARRDNILIPHEFAY